MLIKHYVWLKLEPVGLLSVVNFNIIMAQWLWVLKTETSFISVFFKPDHIVRQQVDLVDSKLWQWAIGCLIRSDSVDTEIWCI